MSIFTGENHGLPSSLIDSVNELVNGKKSTEKDGEKTLGEGTDRSHENYEDKNYKKVFQAVAKHFGTTPEKFDELPDDKKKKAYQMLDQCWDSKDNKVPDSCPIDIKLESNESVELDEANKVLAKKGDYSFVKGKNEHDVERVYYKGKEISRGDFDEGADGWFLSHKTFKGQKFFDTPKEVVDYFSKNNINESVELEEAKMKTQKVKKMGKTFDAYVFKSEKTANDFMEKNDEYSLLHQDDQNSKYYVAKS